MQSNKLNSQLTLLNAMIGLKYLDNGLSDSVVLTNLIFFTKKLELLGELEDEAVPFSVLFKLDELSSSLMTVVDLDEFPASQQSKILKIIDLADTSIVAAVKYSREVLQELKYLPDEKLFDETVKEVKLFIDFCKQKKQKDKTLAWYYEQYFNEPFPKPL